MSTRVHRLRRELRGALSCGEQVRGTFIKMAAPDIVEHAAAVGLDFVVVDLEHSTLSEGDAINLVRHADACAIAAMVRVPTVDAAQVNRLLENGAAGIQLSMLRRRAQVEALRAAARFAPVGTRSISTANRVASMGARGVAELLAMEISDPPILVGQIETGVTDALSDLLPELDVCFVGATDLAVDLGLTEDPVGLRSAVTAIGSSAGHHDTAFGGWAKDAPALEATGLGDASYVVIASDVQLVAAGLLAITSQPGRQELT